MIELRPSTGINVYTKEEELHSYDDIVLDGQIIGISFRFENKVHWRFKKQLIPKAIRKQVVKMLMKRNKGKEVVV